MSDMSDKNPDYADGLRDGILTSIRARVDAMEAWKGASDKRMSRIELIQVSMLIILFGDSFAKPLLQALLK